MTFKLLLLEENRAVARKLGIASALMMTVPILVFYICLNYLCAHKEQPLAWSGFAAVGAANVVIFGYVYSAFSEPDDDFYPNNDNDESGPRVGAFKERTD